jgi:hypothetical protein
MLGRAQDSLKFVIKKKGCQDCLDWVRREPEGNVVLGKWKFEEL